MVKHEDNIKIKGKLKFVGKEGMGYLEYKIKGECDVDLEVRGNLKHNDKGSRW